MAIDDIPQLTASERFYAAIGKPHPAPLTDDERREWEAQQDRVDAEIAARYGGATRRNAT